MSFDLRRSMRTLVLAVWASFFIWMIWSGEIYRYIGPRTYWVIYFGAFALTLALFSQLLGYRQAAPHNASSVKEFLGLGVLLVPILVVLVIPTPKLGAQAAATKSSGGIASSSALRATSLAPGQEVSFVEINYASESDDYAASIGLSDGYEVELTGFVTHPEGLGQYAFALTRFTIFCCAADVIPYSVNIDVSSAKSLAADFDDDTWLTVKGEVSKAGSEYVVIATDIKKVPEPDDPYI